MAPTVYYVVGPPGSGKRTIGKHLSRLTGAALLDNHISNDPIFTAFGLDGVRPIPAEVWDLVGKVRALVREAALAAPPQVSHIFTNWLIADEGEWPSVERLRDLAARRGATFVPVWLTCDTEELARRMTLPERAERLKLRDPEGLRTLLREMGNLPPPRDAIRIDTTNLASADAALLIASHAGALF
ncbi:AAA family ATPase [Deinococcus sp. YIM 134068]|uniref:AAA family ATPase n=1 Tax=Deinococcus lichenicola TaxID=3118910 RepID=UPI002F94BA5B